MARLFFDVAETIWLKPRRVRLKRLFCFEKARKAFFRSPHSGRTSARDIHSQNSNKKNPLLSDIREKAVSSTGFGTFQFFPRSFSAEAYYARYRIRPIVHVVLSRECFLISILQLAHEIPRLPLIFCYTIIKYLCLYSCHEQPSLFVYQLLYSSEFTPAT